MKNRKFCKFCSNRYEKFYNDDEKTKVKDFLANDHKTSDEFHELIAFYRDVAREIPTAIEKTVFSGLFEINLGDFIETLVGALKYFEKSLVDRLVANYQSKAKS